MPPHVFLEPEPTGQSVLFAGVYINLTHLALATINPRTQKPFDPGYVCRIINGSRSPNATIMKALADALMMPLEEFYEAVLIRKGAPRLILRKKLKKTA